MARLPVLRLTARGPRAIGVLLAAVVVVLAVARTLFPPPSPAEIVAMTRALRRQQVISHYLPPGREATHDSAALAEMLRAVEEVERDSAVAVRIRHGVLSPPLARRRRWIVRVHWRSESAPATYSVSRFMAHDAPSWFWYLALP